MANKRNRSFVTPLSAPRALPGPAGTRRLNGSAIQPNQLNPLNQTNQSNQSNQLNQTNEESPAAAVVDPPSAFAAFRTGPQPITTPVQATKVLYTSEQFDLLQEYDTATGNFIPQQTGIYTLNAGIEFFPTTPVAGEQYFVSIAIRVNSTFVASDFEFFPGGEGVVTVSTIQQLQAGDVVDVVASSGRIGNINGNTAAGAATLRSLTRFEGSFIPQVG